MPTYEVAEAGFLRDVAPKEYNGRQFPKKIIGLKFQTGEQCEWYVDASEAIPAPGTTLNGNIQPDPKGKFADSFRQDRNGGSPQATGRPQTASNANSGGGMTDEREKKIIRQHSQEMALRYIDAAQVSITGIQDVKPIIQWFVDDAMGEQQPAAPTLDDALTGDTPPF